MTQNVDFSSNQSVFDAVVRHLFAQGRRAVREKKPWEAGATCLYRAPNGDKCAIGALIPDEDYTPQFESMLAETIPYAREQFKTPHGHAPVFAWIRNNKDFARALQRVHDNEGHWGVEGLNGLGVSELRSNAEYYKLNTTVVDECLEIRAKGGYR